MRKEQVENMAENEKKEPVYERPASQVDLEERMANGNRSSAVLSTSDSYVGAGAVEGRDFRVEGNDTEGYVGVNPEYATYANETEAPILPDAEESAEQKVLDSFGESVASLAQVVNPDEEQEKAEEATKTAQSQAAKSAAGTAPAKAEAAKKD